MDPFSDCGHLTIISVMRYVTNHWYIINIYIYYMGICEGTKLGWTSNNIKAVILLQNIFV